MYSPVDSKGTLPVSDPRAATQGGGGRGTGAWGDDGFTFGDLLDVVNPLQHIPVVSSIYRALTGDEISDAARFAGAGLFGGPLGLVACGAKAALRESGGGSLDALVASRIGGGEPTPAAVTAARSAGSGGADEASTWSEWPLLSGAWGPAYRAAAQQGDERGAATDTFA